MTVAVTQQLSIVGSVTYALQQATAFGTVQLPANSMAFNLANLNLTTWNSIYLATIGPITVSTGTDFNLFSFTDLLNNATGMLHVLGIEVTVNSIGSLRLSSGSSNPMQWFFHGTTTSTDYITIKPASANNAGFSWWDDPTGTGTLISTSTGTLRLTNPSGAVTPTATVLVVGSTA